MSEQRDTILPMFFMDKQLNNFESERLGRPVYEDVEKVEMIIPGDKNARPVTFVRPEHRMRWPTQYAAFKAGQEQAIEGSPIEEWPPLSKATVANLKALGIHTVEALAGLNEIQGQQVGLGWRDLQNKAKLWLDNARSSEPLAAALAENEKLRGEFQALKAAFDDLAARVPKEVAE